MRQVIVLLLLAGIAKAAWAQAAKPDDDVLRVETRMVDVPVSVSGSSDRPLLNLKKDNFLIFEDGEQQEIAEFTSASAPFEVALILDTSGSTRSELALIRKAADEFIRSLRPGDKVSIISYRTQRQNSLSRSRPELVIGLTDDRVALTKALERIGTSNGTPLYDSLLWVTDEVFAEKPSPEFRGRRALVALTDGVDSVSFSQYREVSESLLESGMSIYFVTVDTSTYFEKGLLGDCKTSIRFSPSQMRRYYSRFDPQASLEKQNDFCLLDDFERVKMSRGLYAVASEEMSYLVSASGGSVTPVKDLAGARQAFMKVAAEIGTRYSLGYYSTNERRDGAYRKIRVELRGVTGGAVVRAREGYRAPVD